MLMKKINIKDILESNPETPADQVGGKGAKDGAVRALRRLEGGSRRLPTGSFDSRRG
jgi:hypothetical protein